MKFANKPPMQSRYAADLGDYVKLAILRRLQHERRLGVIWWLYPDEGHNSDGKHVTYLDRAVLWREFDPLLFDGLKALIARGQRSVAALEAANLLPAATYFSDVLPTTGPAHVRRLSRAEWFTNACKAVAACDLVFVDPDNGLETKGFSPGQLKAGKSIALNELAALRRPGRTLIVYHHHTRMAGGNIVELQYWGGRLESLGFRVDAIRASAGTARSFFILDGSDRIRSAAQAVTESWRGKMTWHPHLGDGGQSPDRS